MVFFNTPLLGLYSITQLISLSKLVSSSSDRSVVGINQVVRESIPFSYCARPGRLIVEVERHTYSQLPVTYRTDRITQAVLLIR